MEEIEDRKSACLLLVVGRRQQNAIGNGTAKNAAGNGATFGAPRRRPCRPDACKAQQCESPEATGPEALIHTAAPRLDSVSPRVPRDKFPQPGSRPRRRQ